MYEQRYQLQFIYFCYFYFFHICFREGLYLGKGMGPIIRNIYNPTLTLKQMYEQRYQVKFIYCYRGV